jgi:hypothetical protein
MSDHNMDSDLEEGEVMESPSSGFDLPVRFSAAERRPEVPSFGSGLPSSSYAEPSSSASFKTSRTSLSGPKERPRRGEDEDEDEERHRKAPGSQPAQQRASWQPPLPEDVTKFLRAEKLPSPYGSHDSHTAGPLLPYPFNRDHKLFMMQPLKERFGSEQMNWPAVMQVDEDVHGSFEKAETIVKFTVDACASYPNWSVLVHNSSSTGSISLMWDMTLVTEVDVKCFDLRDPSIAKQSLRSAFYKMLGRHFDDETGPLALDDNTRNEFARVTFTTAKNVEPAYYCNGKTDWSPREGYCAHENPPTFAFEAGSSSESIQTMSYSKSQITLWVYIGEKDRRVMDRFSDIINIVSQCGKDSEQRGDWWASRHPDYRIDKASGFMDFFNPKLRTQDKFPEREPWLMNGEISIPIWRATRPKSRFASPKGMSDVYTKGLLHELEQKFRLVKEQFGPEQEVEVVLENSKSGFDTGKILAKVKCSPDHRPAGAVGVEMYEPAHYQKKDFCWTGKVAENAPKGFGFCFWTVLPSGYPHSIEEGSRKFKFEPFRQYDQQAGYDLAGMSSFASLRQGHPPSGDADNRANFYYRDIYVGRNVTTLGPDFYGEWKRNVMPSLPSAHAAAVKHFVEVVLPDPSETNPAQVRYYWLVLRGCRAAHALLQGCPGSGKSKTFQKVICALLLMGYRILICAQSNSGCDAVTEKTAAFLYNTKRQGLSVTSEVRDWIAANRSLGIGSDKIVRITSSTIAGKIMAQLQSGKMPKEVVVEKVSPGLIKYTAATMQYRWLRFSDKPVAEAYRAYSAARDRVRRDFKSPDEKVKASKDYTWGQAKSEVFTEAVLKKEPQLISCTSAMWQSLLDEGSTDGMCFDLLVFDEASQAMDSALLGVVQQTNVRVLALGGDQEQLKPFLESEGKNPVAAQLSHSPLARIVDAFPDRPFVQLMTNYRGHPDTVLVSSKIAYKGRMLSGWKQNGIEYPSSPFARNVVLAIKNKSFMRGIFPSERAEHRQWFLNVRGHSRDVLEKKKVGPFNKSGQAAIMELVDELMKVAGAEQKLITIITMYGFDQIMLQRTLLEKSLGDIEVATVDSYQGRENRIVIVHLAASWQPLIQPDMKCQRVNPIGFMGDKRRLNVALSRAQDYSILVGDFAYWEERIQLVNKQQRQVYRSPDGKTAPRFLMNMQLPFPIMMKHVHDEQELVQYQSDPAGSKGPLTIPTNHVREDAYAEQVDWDWMEQIEAGLFD